MNALQVQFRDELGHWMAQVLGVDCSREHVSVYDHFGMLEFAFGIGTRLTMARMPYGKVRERYSYQRDFAILVLNGMLQDGIYE